MGGVNDIGSGVTVPPTNGPTDGTELTRKQVVSSRPEALQSHASQHMKLSFEALNVRIARLAIALGISLSNEGDMARVMNHPGAQVPSQDRRSNSEHHDLTRMNSSPERRTLRSWEELRGLLVLRYDAEKDCVEQLGVVATREILTGVEEHLLRQGFKPGEDGVDL